MEIAPAVPLVGLVIIVANVMIAAVSRRAPPRLMGIELFFAGMITLIISVVSLINPVGISLSHPNGIVGFERLVLFVAGSLNCSAGYYMVLLETRR